MTEQAIANSNEDLMSEEMRSKKTLTTIIYALLAAGIVTSGITSIVAVIINYVKKSEVQGTWLESHFKWQIRTFWYSLLWGIIGFIGTFFIIGIPVLIANAIWVIYRIVKGWLRLNDNKEMYTKT